MERAWVKLGGFLIGVEDSFFTTWTGYASGVVNDGLIAYGPFTTHTIQYVWDGGTGFSVGAAVEEGDSGFGTIIQDYAPHATVGAKWAGAVFAFRQSSAKTPCRTSSGQGPCRHHRERRVLVLHHGRLDG